MVQQNDGEGCIVEPLVEFAKGIKLPDPFLAALSENGYIEYDMIARKHELTDLGVAELESLGYCHHGIHEMATCADCGRVGEPAPSTVPKTREELKEKLGHFGQVPTLHDQFAMAALTGILAKGDITDSNAAKHALRAADAIMEQREQ